MLEASLTLVQSVQDANNLMTWLGERRSWLGIDTETEGLDWWRDGLRLVQLGDANAGWVVPWEQWGGVAKQAIEAYAGPTVMHNSKFDLHMLEHNGVNINRRNLHDSMPMAGLVEPHRRKGLKEATGRHVSPDAATGQKLLRAAMSKNKWTWATVPIELEEYWVYSALDPVLTVRLAEILYPRMQNQNLMAAYNVEVAVAQVLTDMETAGIGIDMEYVQRNSALLSAEAHRLNDWFKNTLGIKNPNSDKQLIAWFQKMGYVFSVFTEKGNISLASEVLDSISVNSPELGPVADAVNRLRDCQKMSKTYFDGFIEFADDNNRIHTQINPMKAITARMSSERPNMQNIPARKHGKLLRDAFVPAQGHKFIAADFDQIEYRIMVARAGEQNLIDAINAGEDLHTYMTSVVYDKPTSEVLPAERSVMKNATFAFLYGAGDAKFAAMAGIPLSAAKDFRHMYKNKFPAIAQYAQILDAVGKTSGTVRTGYLGRNQTITNKDESYKLLNYATQGEAGDVLKQKMVELSMTDAGDYMRLPIHDEIIFEVPDERVDEIKGIIEDVMPENDFFSVPLSVGAEVKERWGDNYEAD